MRNKGIAGWSALVLLGFVRIAASAEPAPAGAELRASLLKLKSGLTLNYVVQGDPKGPPIVLLHGVGDSWHSWELVLPHLPKTFRVYAVTLRGHGLTDHPASGYTRADFAGDVTQFLAELDLRDVRLVGHSLGSFVAQEVVETDDAGRVSRLVLVGSGPGGPRDPAVTSGLRDLFASLRDPIDETFARDFQSGTAYQPLPPAFLETMIGEVRRVPARVWNELASHLADATAVERLARIRVPTLLLWGDKDGMLTRADQDGLLAGIKGSKLVVYANTGHALHWEEPVRFAQDLAAFAR
jgi:pimeloyl-ACP methyl ester carboxylesterase